MDSIWIGRIPNEWARCLLPLVRDKKIRIEGSCKSAPAVLSLMDTIILSVSVYINSSMFHQSHQISLKATGSSTDDSVIHPLPTIFRLLGLTPFQKAEFTPSDLCSKSDPLNSKEKFDTPATLLHLNKFKNPSPNGDAVENEECISDADLDDIVGVGDSSELEGTIVVLFQPAEEAGNGVKKMIEDGALEDVEAIFAVHVSHQHLTGVIGSRPGPLLAGCGIFRVVITGKQGPRGIHTTLLILFWLLLLLSLVCKGLSLVNPTL